MNVPESKLLVSLHDVSPRHAASVRSIVAWLGRFGIPPVQLLVVPDFHGKWPLASHAGFCQEVSAWGGLGHELVLHGYFHLESPRSANGPETLRSRFQRRFLTAGEGEFLSLDAKEAGLRIDRGLDMWAEACLSPRPRGFIPPAWLHRPDLDAALWERGFDWTEDHQGFRFRDGRRLASPVVTWASRDPLRRIGSRIYCPSAVRLHAKADLLRLAIHPHDFDHPSLIRSIEHALRLALRDRRPVGSLESLK
jgi:uncharacterized protein